MTFLVLAFSVLLLPSCGNLLERGLEAADLVFDSEKNLVLYYPFNGNTQDHSGNGHHGVLNGTATYNRDVDRFGNTDSNFGVGPGGHLDTTWGNGFNPVNAFAINFWVWYPNFVSEPGETYLLGIASSTYPPVGIRFYLSKEDSGDMKFLMTSTGLSSDEDSITFTNLWSSFQDADWHMVTLVHSEGTGADKLAFYVDGVKITPDSSRSGFSATQFDGSIFLLAARQLNNTTGLNNSQYASIDDFRLYNRAINQKEIDALYFENGYLP